MSEKLKPCPFCGGAARMAHFSLIDGQEVVGIGCETEECILYFDGKKRARLLFTPEGEETAVKRWNARKFIRKY